MSDQDKGFGGYERMLVPASLLPESEEPGWRTRRRTARDWTVDVTFFALSVIFGALFFLVQTDAAPPGRALIVMDLVLGAVACLGLWLRRRRPVGVAVLLALISAVSASSVVAASLALFGVAVHRRMRVALPVAVLYVATGVVYFWLRPQPDQPLWLMLVLTVAVASALVAWGMFVRARRQLVWSLHERAERAEAEQRLLAEQARLAERARIAREMHDVLAHRVSLMVLHAGALEVRPDLSPAEVQRTAGLIRTTARQALEELREVIGVLRNATDASDAPQAPQPELGDVSRLVDDWQRAGTHVELQMRVHRPESVPRSLGRNAYRIVQEALTNVTKHAPGTVARVDISGGPGNGLRVTVENPLPLDGSPAATLPGTGSGLVGLAERVALAGGTLSHGPTPRGKFVVTAELPWPE